MGNSTSIEWAANADGTPGATWNPIRARDRETGLTGTFCVHASPGCKNCYAETMQGRKLPGNGIGLAYTAPNLARVEQYLDEKMLAAPLRKRKPTTWFLSSMTDVFGEWVPDAMIDRLFAVMMLAPQHTFIVVTKRAERMRKYATEATGRDGSTMTTARDSGFCIEREMRIREASAPLSSLCLRDDRPIRFPLPNVWLVVSVENQANADERIPHLLATPAAVRGVSCEPLLAATDVTPFLYIHTHADEAALDLAADDGAPLILPFRDPATTPAYDIALPRLDWVICGGESGRNARPMHPDWARSLRDQCAAAGVPFFFKQWGEYQCAPIDPQARPAHASCIDASGRECAASRTERGWFFLGPGATHWRSVDFVPPGVVQWTRLGKARAGRLLDGQEHNARPPLAHADGGGKDG